MFSRHYHRVTHERTPMASRNRRDLEAERRSIRSRLLKWFAVGVMLFSSALGCLLFLNASR